MFQDGRVVHCQERATLPSQQSAGGAGAGPKVRRKLSRERCARSPLLSAPPLEQRCPDRLWKRRRNRSTLHKGIVNHIDSAIPFCNAQTYQTKAGGGLLQNRSFVQLRLLMGSPPGDSGQAPGAPSQLQFPNRAGRHE